MLGFGRVLSCCTLGLGAAVLWPLRTTSAQETFSSAGVVQDKDGRLLRLKQVQVSTNMNLHKYKLSSIVFARSSFGMVLVRRSIICLESITKMPLGT
jgi:hypothetical protein